MQNETETEKRVKLSLRVPAEFRRKLRMLAAYSDSDMQELVLQALEAQYPELR